eukprot:gene26110-11827_t
MDNPRTIQNLGLQRGKAASGYGAYGSYEALRARVHDVYFSQIMDHLAQIKGMHIGIFVVCFFLMLFFSVYMLRPLVHRAHEEGGQVVLMLSEVHIPSSNFGRKETKVEHLLELALLTNERSSEPGHMSQAADRRRSLSKLPSRRTGSGKLTEALTPPTRVGSVKPRVS